MGFILLVICFSTPAIRTKLRDAEEPSSLYLRTIIIPKSLKTSHALYNAECKVLFPLIRW